MGLAYLGGLTRGLLKDFSEDVGWGYSHLNACLTYRICFEDGSLTWLLAKRRSTFYWDA